MGSDGTAIVARGGCIFVAQRNGGVVRDTERDKGTEDRRVCSGVARAKAGDDDIAVLRMATARAVDGGRGGEHLRLRWRTADCV